MSEKIIKEFTFTAPTTDYNLEGANERQIVTNYKGANSIWIYVDINTGKNPLFMSEGDLPDPTNTWRHRSVLLNANNNNHLLLMDLLSSCKGHTNNEEYTVSLNNIGDIEGAEQFVFLHTDLTNPPASRYYDLNETHVDENGVVTYQYFPYPDIDGHKNILKIMLEAEIIKTQERLKDPVVMETPAAVARCNRHIAVLTYAKDVLLPTTDPWKIAVPGIHEV